MCGVAQSADGTEVSRGGGSSRHRAREIALQVLYAVDLVRRRRTEEGTVEGTGLAPWSSADLRRIFDGVTANFEAPARAREFAYELVERVALRGDELDVSIAAEARNWRISRMAVVDRNILRLAAYELRYTETPAAVVLDEAIELARRFGSDDSPAFVNGILDAVASSVRGSGSSPRE